MAFTRRGYDWANRFGSIAEATKALPVREAIMDGEIIVLDPDGLSDFSALQSELAAGRSDRLVFYAFDLMYADGYDLRQSPLLARKEAMERILADTPKGRFLYSKHLAYDGPTIHARACEMNIEGIVSKLIDSPYRSGRNESWVKASAESARPLPWWALCRSRPAA